ncbi:MAG: hypothetical protein KF850_18670 [Labilithrix sp.]|nr:hypothetical protein [Labilithrix sp.]
MIAEKTGLSYAIVRGRLVRAHGRTLLRNLFAELWRASRVGSKPSVRQEPAPNGPAARHPAQPAAHTIHRVRQEFSTSCGVAVVAMFARVSHREAMSIMFPNGTTGDYRTWLKDLKRALDHFGVTYASRWFRFRSWEEIPTTSLVKVRWRKSDGAAGAHWVIFQRRKTGEWRVIDPDPPRGGTLRLSSKELSWYTGVTYLAVNAREP